MRSKFARPRLEVLEDRTVPAAFSTPWPDGSHLTLSFLADGTTVQNQTSALFNTMNNSPLVPSNWQREILRAFQTWARETNINLGIVSDGGQESGIAGAIQGDSRFGDIRVGAVLIPGSMAQAIPFDWLAGTGAGDLFLNTRTFQQTDAIPDIFTVVLHEAGHIFGLAHNPDPASPLYYKYTVAKPGLIASDISNIRALYGVRLHDAFDTQARNETQLAASLLSANAAGETIEIEADITERGELDWYQFETTASASGGVTIRLRTAGLSLLSGRVGVYDSNGTLLGQATAVDPGQDLVLTLASVSASTSYFIRVDGPSGDAFDVGAYNLRVEAQPGSLVTTGSTLGAPPPRLASGFHNGTLAVGGSQTVTFTLSPQNIGDTLVVQAWFADASAGRPVLTVLDLSNQVIASQVIVGQAGMTIVKANLANIAGGFQVRVEGDFAAGQTNPVAFTLAAYADNSPMPAETLENAHTLTEVGQPQYGALWIEHSQWFHVALSTQSTLPGAQLELVIRDGNTGATVATLLVDANETGSLTVFLTEGVYAMQLTLLAPPGSSGSLTFTLSGRDLSDPIGPEYVRVLLDPFDVPSFSYWFGWGYSPNWPWLQLPPPNQTPATPPPQNPPPKPPPPLPKVPPSLIAPG